MGLSFDQVAKIQDEYSQEYRKEPYSRYISRIGISRLGRMCGQKKSFDLKENETLEDRCLSVSFREEPPKNLEFPSEYRGLRVFYEVVGGETVFA